MRGKRVIILDEASLFSQSHGDVVLHMARALGIRVIFIGDFGQVCALAGV
jgi:thymidine kinase